MSSENLSTESGSNINSQVSESSGAGEKKYFAVKHIATGKVYDVPADDLEFKVGGLCIVKTPKGNVVAKVTAGPYLAKSPDLMEDGWCVLRMATDKDLGSIERNRVRERDAFLICRKKIEKLGLPMNLIRCEMTLGGGRAAFYFSSDGRVDFRALIREMAQEMHMRIEMVQIGVRDETRAVGGLGVCGREFCCSAHMRKFSPVSIKMAKEQNLPLNPQKVSGGCGRLLCCLGYEYETYKYLNENMPKVGKRVKTPRGIGRVKYLDVFRQKVVVQYEGGVQEIHDKNDVERYIPPQQVSSRKSSRGRRGLKKRIKDKGEGESEG